MSQSYQKNCQDCKQEITMIEMNGKWGAYNLDGSFHKCKPVAAIAPKPNHKRERKETLTRNDGRKTKARGENVV